MSDKDRRERRSSCAEPERGGVNITYQRRCALGPILYLSRRTLGRGLPSLCRGYRSESWSSPFYVSGGSRQSSPHIHLEDENEKKTVYLEEPDRSEDRWHCWFNATVHLYFTAEEKCDCFSAAVSSRTVRPSTNHAAFVRFSSGAVSLDRPVMDLMVSLETVWPMRSYWTRLEDSGGTSTECCGPLVQV